MTATDIASENNMAQRVAGALIVTCAKFYGDRVPDTFDMTLSNLLANAAIEACGASAMYQALEIAQASTPCPLYAEALAKARGESP
jgi:hypothetical protein